MPDVNHLPSHYTLEEVQVTKVHNPVLSTLLVSVLNRTAWRYLNAVHPRVDVFKVHIHKSHSLKGSGSKTD